MNGTILRWLRSKLMSKALKRGEAFPGTELYTPQELPETGAASQVLNTLEDILFCESKEIIQ